MIITRSSVAVVVISKFLLLVGRDLVTVQALHCPDVVCPETEVGSPALVVRVHHRSCSAGVEQTQAVTELVSDGLQQTHSLIMT